ncbi:MAG: hypothetical protein M3Q08_08250 [Pseudomonadota bacterium]|nr:hypothetical protein [Pseudomonadota bacterium]
MSANFSGGLIGLSLLSGNSSLFGLFSGRPIESRAVRTAKAQFTAPVVAAPWQQPAPTTPIPTQVAMIKRMASIIDKPSSREAGLLPDIQATFTAYKALDLLRLLAETAVKTGTASAERLALGQAFDKGLEDLQNYLASAPSDKVKLAFGDPRRRAESVGIPAQSFDSKTLGSGLLVTRDAPLQGISGNEVLKVSLSKNGQTDVVTVDLAQTPQPPTLDSVAAALNAAIATIPMRNPDGSVVLDASGNEVPKYAARFAADKGSGKWGLALNASHVEKVALDQVGAKDALIVASGSTALDAPTATQILRFDDPAATLARRTLGTVSALDREATERAALTPPAKTLAGTTPPPAQIWATTTARAIATDAEGSSYVVGTTAGDLGSNRSDGDEDLFLTKLNSEGKVVWQRTLGAAGSSQGAAVTVAANGDIVVAGTVAGPFDGSVGSDSDMLVVRFDANGDEKFATSVRTVGNEEASAVTVGADGSIYVGGKASSGGGDAFIARIDATGTLSERRVIDGGGSEGVTALAIDGSGQLLALTREGGTARLRRVDAQALGTDLGAIDLGAADARAIAVSKTGEIAVGGATSTALSGTAIGAPSGGRDGFVARIDAALTGATVTYIGTGADDQVDSVTYMSGALYVGGRTTGDLDGARRGAVDGFLSRLDSGTGAIQSINQFGQAALRTEPVRIASAAGGAGVTGALGFQRGILNVDISPKLTAQTSLRPGDVFTVRVNGGAPRKVVIQAGDTLSTLAQQIRSITQASATVSTPKTGDKSALRIETKPGNTIELTAGPEGKDALAKLGIEPTRLSAPSTPAKNAPKVQPGGSYGLGLKDAMSIDSVGDAAVALKAVKSALSMTQTAFRSLYWDSSKARLVDGANSGSGGSPYQQAQLAKYQDALARLTGGSGS